MNDSSIPGKAVDGALRLARFPADRLLKFAPEKAPVATVGLAIDRADAAVRGAAGSVLSDKGLREDAERRRAATDERKRAMRLRGEAQERVETAEALTEETRAESAARRRQADEKAEQKRKQAADQRGRLKEQADKVATKRKQEAQAEAEEVKESAEERGKIDRLEEVTGQTKEERKAGSRGRK